jgi:DNA end-binding protein Ku
VSPRPYWKGYLRLALVSCPIELHAACSSAQRISFRQINRNTGNRLRQQLIDEETRDVVEGHDKARGYEIGKGQFLVIEDEELEAIEIASTHTIEIDSLVPRAEIDQRFLDTPYYISPNEPVGHEAFAVIRVMRSKALVALGRVVLSKRERVMALEPYDKCDRYEEALLAHLKSKQAGLPPQPQQGCAVHAGPSTSSRP